MENKNNLKIVKIPKEIAEIQEVRINIELIKQFMKDHSLSKAKLAKECGVASSAVSKLLAGKFNIRANTVFKIAKYIGVPIKDMFEVVEKRL